MAFSFKNIINKIKQQFTPKTFLNIDTGEIIKSKEYKQLEATQKELYLPTRKIGLESDSVQQEVNKIKTPNQQVNQTRIKKPVQEKPKTGKIISKEERERRKEFRKELGIDKRTNKSKEKKREKDTYEDIKPPKPPKKITQELEEKLAEPPVPIDSIESLKAQIRELERKNFPMVDLSSARGFLMSIIEDNEGYYEDTNDYHNYLIQNEEEISEAITSVEYYGSTQEEIDGYLTELATLLNMGALSSLQSDELENIRNAYGWNSYE